MKKNLLVILLCGVITLGITGCGTSNTDTDYDKGKNENHEKQYENISVLKSDKVDTTILIKFDGVLYGMSNAVIDYVSDNKLIGTIDKLIDSQYIPMIDGETNTKEILNALVYDKTENTIVVNYNDDYVLFEKIIW